MAEIVREPYVFSVEVEYLRVFKDGIEVDCALLSQVSCEEGRHYLVFPALLMNANFSQEEWDVMQGTSSVAEEPVAEEVTPVVATTRRGRRRA